MNLRVQSPRDSARRAHPSSTCVQGKLVFAPDQISLTLNKTHFDVRTGANHDSWNVCLTLTHERSPRLPILP